MRYLINTNDGEEIAVIIKRDAKKDGDIQQIVYIKDVLDGDHVKDDTITKNKLEYIYKNLISKTKARINFKQAHDLLQHIQTKQPPIGNPILEDLYNQAMTLLEENYNAQMILDQKELIFFPTFNLSKERMIFYVTGASGSGKSTFTSNLASIYNKIYPENSVYLFSNKETDPVFDQKKFIKRINMKDEQLIKEPLDLKELEKSLILFDDNEHCKSKAVDNEMKRLSDLILVQGRAKEISYVLINHLSTEYRKTRQVLNEMSVYVFFCGYTTKYSVSYVLGKYFGLDKNMINKIFNLPSRWVAILKHPMVCISEKECFLLT